uniref:Uncharacterized protein n=1 Tax=Steinernema glaseri TaxID=37863 RepID=A0A1I7ZNG8_9BILA
MNMKTVILFLSLLAWTSAKAPKKTIEEPFRNSLFRMNTKTAILFLSLLAWTSAKAPKKTIEEVAKEVDNMAKKLAELTKFSNIEEDLKLIDEVVQAVHYWPYFKNHLQQPPVFQKAGYELAHQFTVLRDRYLTELNNLPCPLTNDFTRHNVKYMDIDEHSKKSLDITDKRFCSEDQRKEVGPKVAQMEFTVYMLVMKICYEDHYKGNPESIANYRRKQTEVFKQFLPKLKTVF